MAHCSVEHKLSEPEQVHTAGLSMQGSRDGKGDTSTTAARGQGTTRSQAPVRQWTPKSLTHSIQRSGLDASFAQVVAQLHALLRNGVIVKRACGIYELKKAND